MCHEKLKINHHPGNPINSFWLNKTKMPESSPGTIEDSLIHKGPTSFEIQRIFGTQPARKSPIEA